MADYSFNGKVLSFRGSDFFNILMTSYWKGCNNLTWKEYSLLVTRFRQLYTLPSSLVGLLRMRNGPLWLLCNLDGGLCSSFSYATVTKELIGNSVVDVPGFWAKWNMSVSFWLRVAICRKLFCLLMMRCIYSDICSTLLYGGCGKVCLDLGQLIPRIPYQQVPPRLLERHDCSWFVLPELGNLASVWLLCYQR